MTAALTTLAADIRREYDAAQDAFAAAVEHAIRAGELLHEAKGQLPHGAWLPWLAEHFPASERTARGYMRLAANRQRVADLGPASLREALASLSEPRDTPADVGALLDEASALTETAIGRFKAGEPVADIAEAVTRAAALANEAARRDHRLLEALEARLAVAPTPEEVASVVSDVDAGFRRWTVFNLRSKRQLREVLALCPDADDCGREATAT